MSYRLPNLSLEQYKLLSADEQYLLISSIHTLYEQSLLGGAVAPVINLPSRHTQVTTPARASRSPQPRQRAFRKGSSSAFVMGIFTDAGSDAAFTPDQIYSQLLGTKVTKNALWRTLHALAKIYLKSLNFN